MPPEDAWAVYGSPPRELADVPAGAVQLSPLKPGSQTLEGAPEGSFDGAVVLAPPGAIERRYVLAQVLRALKPDAPLTALAPKAKGGGRIFDELSGFGCEVEEGARRHHRICVTRRPQALSGLDAAIAAGAPRRVEGLGWTQPGVFSWDRRDAGTALLADHLPPLSGVGADFGCGVGILGRQVLASPAVTRLHLIDLDGRAVACARRNVADPRACFEWADVRSFGETGLDFVVMNPPFHDGGAEDRALGQAFIAAAAKALRKGGVMWMVANRHLPYEGVLSSAFGRVTPKGEGGGYKLFEAVR